MPDNGLFSEVDRLELELRAARERIAVLEAPMPTSDMLLRELHVAIARCDDHTSLLGLLQQQGRTINALSTEIAHFASAEFNARERAAESDLRVQELEAEVEELKERLEWLGKEPVPPQLST